MRKAPISKQVKEGDLTFDSKAEYKLWQWLNANKGGLQVGRVFSVDILPRSHNFPPRRMEVDFWIGYSDRHPLFLVEYKGDWISANKTALSLYRLRLQLLELHSPANFSRLVIIGSSDLGLPQQMTLTDFSKKLKQVTQ